MFAKLVALGVAFGLLLGACGEDSLDRDSAIDSFSAANPEATPSQSACVVDRLIERLGLDGLDEQLGADPPDPEFEEMQFRDMFACGLEGDVRVQIVDQLEINGVAPADAPCVADVIVDDLTDADIDVLLSGVISDEFLAKFIDAMESCGAINSP
ncbi:MAG: hypothetical protein AAF531_20120 [Actinomycetota bacterium]